jgi:glycosyltransferase involved in cell wall biosynthesis
VKIVYFIIAYGPEFISNEVHEELGLRMRARGHEFVALTLTGADPHPASPVEGGVREASPVGGGVREASPAGGGVGGLQRSESQNGIPIYKIRVGGHQQRLAQTVLHYNNFFAVLDGYKRFLREYPRADIIHAEAAYPLGAIATLGTPRDGPLIVPNLQGADVLNYPEVDYGYGRYRAARYLLRRTFAAAAAVRCNSPMMRDFIIRAYGCAPGKAKVILRNIGSWSFLPPGTDLPDYRAASRAALEQQYPQLKGRPFILSISRLHPFKGIEYLLEALNLAGKGVNQSTIYNLQSAILMVAGPGRSTAHFGDYATFLQRKAVELGIAERVIFSGEIPYTQSRDYLAAADVVAISSVVDALNKVALEAAAVGSPTLLTASTGAAPYVEQEGIGVVVPPRNAAALATGLNQALASDISLAAMSRGPAWAEQFRSAPIADRLLELYEEALGRPANGL